jgi:hypothetical protein
MNQENVNKYCFSETGWNDKEVILSIVPKMIVHDWRGFHPDQSVDEGYLEGFYISNKYLWVLEYNKYRDGSESIELYKYSRNFWFVSEPIKFTLVQKWSVDPNDEIGQLIKQFILKHSSE